MTWEQYVAEFSGNSAWGGSLEMAAPAWELQLRVWIVTEHWQAYRGVNEDSLRKRFDEAEGHELSLVEHLFRGELLAPLLQEIRGLGFPYMILGDYNAEAAENASSLTHGAAYCFDELFNFCKRRRQSSGHLYRSAAH